MFFFQFQSQRNQNKVKYNIDSAVDVLGQIQFSGKGELVVKKQYGEYDADVKVSKLSQEIPNPNLMVKIPQLKFKLEFGSSVGLLKMFF